MDTKIWGWHWLADSSNTPLITPCIEELRNATVHCLLDGHDRWDEDIVRDIFHADDVPRIIATPVNNRFNDCWRWIGDIRGRYTVQHGYHLLAGEALHTKVDSNFQAWKALWALPIPPKVKNLLWRCVRGVLPVRDNLRLKRIWIGGGCPMCGYVTETTNHLFCDCAFTKGVWELDDVLQGKDFLNFMDYVIGSSTREVTGPKLQFVPFKCNVDAAIFGDGAGFGAVVRDHEGRFVAAKNGRLGSERDPFVAEALAVMAALTWLKEQSLNNIFLESDCLNLCTAFNSVTVDFSYVGLIVKQCQSIAKDIGTVNVSHVKRSANRVAHELARAAGSISGPEVWSSVPPACIFDLLSL
ncbi:PREDICTED: uncharacterized protein LOC109152486 [Ipomoea nil]|uniref:uncharacterized protein LOC109152486 n=1 Tax=Ipomoea nil TaxID=35883 RepID=UPI0009019C8A|nr:PREDICTED: uncharacterized protein LOC109152486 [Ipomoea nil]